MNWLKKLTDTSELTEENRVFTLDHDGGLVVSIEEVVWSHVMDRQFKAVQLLRDRQQKNAADAESSAVISAVEPSL